MRTLRNTLYISLTLQICLAAAILAAAEEAPLALFTLPLALGTLFVIDLMGWLSPPRLLLNVTALGAMGLALLEFQEQGESRLLAGGHLVVYLMWTFLLQQKDLRRMWWMFALSVLQVAVGAPLANNQPWFGAALFVYTASTVWTMSLLSLTRAALLAEPQLLAPKSKLPDSEEVVEAPFLGYSYAQNGVRTDEQGRWISPRFLGGGLVTFALILVVGMTFFVLTPRVWIGNLNVFGDSPLRGAGGATGFTENVKLGDIGEVMESHELVMEVQVLNGETGQPIPPAELAAAVGDEPLFRGAVLEHYTAGSWKKGEYDDAWQESFDVPGPVRLNITLQPLDSAVLFYTGIGLGARGFTDPKQLFYQPHSQALELIGKPEVAQLYSYTVSTTPPRDIPHRRSREEWKRFDRLHPVLEQRLLDTSTERLSRLARQVLDQSNQAGEKGSEATARVLEEYLRDSNEFSYTLDLSVDDPRIDPVEDFVFNRKKGHCEYFASALALMLRGVGIPSRLISGFKGAEYNEKTGQLEVRALHAHAWVEGFVDGGWVTFDPTPGERDTEVATKAKDAAPDFVDQTRSMWFQGMSYSKSQQDELVYAPLRDLGEMVKNNFAGLMQGELPLLTQLKNLSASPSRWFSGEGGTVALFLLVTTAGGAWLARMIFRRWKGWTHERELAQRRAVTVEFYARLLHLLQRFGLADIQTLTPREFALRAEEQFQSRFHSAGITGIALALVDSFYAVRFGDQPLSADQLNTVDQQLGRLEQSLAQAVPGLS